MSDKISVAIIGAGSRGSGFASIIKRFGNQAEVVAVAEPRESYRHAIAEAHDIPDDRVFDGWESFVKQDKLCDAVIISTLDREHVEPAVACLDLGYHMLLEKPMAVTLEDCRAIAEAQSRNPQTITTVCHSMRYGKSFDILKKIVDSGRIGEVVTIDNLEQVAWWHQAHSYVRGNWGNEGRSSFMLMAKSCHDVDYMTYLVGKKCLKVSSFGGLKHFTEANAPEGSGERCVDCAVEPNCKYSAIREYVDTDRTTWPAAVCSFDHSYEAHLEAISNGPYGKCVYKTDNDVVDHQVLAMEFEDGITATFTMTAFTAHGSRKMRVHGTEGEIEFTEKEITIRTFGDGNTETIVPGPEQGGHGGGDPRVVRAWLNAIAQNEPGLVISDVHESLRTHRVVFAAEKSRREGKTISPEEL